jgi:uncharacterized protein
MSGEISLDKLLKTMKPKHNAGEFVFCSLTDVNKINFTDIVLLFREKEGFTVILRRRMADNLNLNYSFITAWITLPVHSPLQGAGFIADFSKAFSNSNIRFNMVSAFYHDHVFVDSKDVHKAMGILNRLLES